MSAENNLPSQFQIGDDVEFKRYPIMDEGEPWAWGTVVAVRFTKAKVYYDCIGDVDARVWPEVPSEYVKSLLSSSPVSSHRK